MAAKTGLNFFAVDTDIFQDIRIKRLKKNNGCDGFAVYMYILNEIYRVKGYFLEWGESSAFDVAEYFGLKETKVEGIVSFCSAVGLFDKVLLRRGVITSAAIQRRYLEMCNRMKRKDITILPEYNLLENSNSGISGENSGISGENSGISGENSGSSGENSELFGKIRENSGSFQQSKVKYSKGKESITPPPNAHTRTEEVHHAAQNGGGGISSYQNGGYAYLCTALRPLLSDDDYSEAMRLTSWGDESNFATMAVRQWIDLQAVGKAEEFYMVIQSLQNLEDMGQIVTAQPNRMLWKAQWALYNAHGVLTEAQAKELINLSKTHQENFIGAVNEWKKNRAKINSVYNFIKSRMVK